MRLGYCSIVRFEVLICLAAAILGFGGCSSPKQVKTHANPAGDQSAVNGGLAIANEGALAPGDVGSDRLSRVRPVIGNRGMVVSDDRIASEWGAEILRKGGNAMDAAVATAFMLSVTRPHYGSLGGGGFLVYCPAKQKCTAIDYREKAPSAATRDMYLRNGKADTDLSQDGALASGVPGVPAGILTALEKFGTRKREVLLRQPIRIAEHGFRFTGLEETAAVERWSAFNKEAKKILGCKISLKSGAKAGIEQGLEPCPVGTFLKQPDLAKVLREISAHGKDGFYSGWVGRKIVNGIAKAGGILTIKDLEQYRPKIREPLVGKFHGMEVVTMPPPSSGGVHLLQMLGFMNRAEKKGELSQGFGSAESIHAEAHAMALAFADRAKYLGDTDYVKVPIHALLSEAYLDQRWATFDPGKANPPADAGILPNEPQNTTHFSVIDRYGNAVAITTTINDEYGSGFVPPGTGVFMNDEMDDFSAQPGVPNMFGLVGGEANAIAAGKRPLSSMTPTIVRDSKGEVHLVLGAAGGPRIITAVFNVLVNRYEFGMLLPDAVSAPRVHDQWKPDELRVEQFGFSPGTREALTKLGYSVKETPALAKMHAIERFPNARVWGVPDIRGEGAAVAE
jgi:gamma-glutamyltranspeptidase/glutathione hydrolase